jgi:arsenite methyltransferase
VPETRKLDLSALRDAIQWEYNTVAACPTRGFHFHTGRMLVQRLGYDQTLVGALPEQVVESFAGVGNPFMLGPLHPGETVVDVGSGAGFDSILGARQVGPAGG